MDKISDDQRNYIAHLVSLLPMDTVEKCYQYELAQRKAMSEGYASLEDKIETLIVMDYGQCLTIDKVVTAFKTGIM